MNHDEPEAGKQKLGTELLLFVMKFLKQHKFIQGSFVQYKENNLVLGFCCLVRN